ncbi:MAG TPA: hypothetical protein VHB69_15395 [Mycobacteriales bacterium]|nr:hypothetical protein [Mycobacteriales bacterium]
MNNRQPDSMWVELAAYEREIYRDSPELAAKFDRWECPPDSDAPQPVKPGIIRRVTDALVKPRSVAPATRQRPTQWHDTRTVLPRL